MQVYLPCLLAKRRVVLPPTLGTMFMKLYGTGPDMCANAGGFCGALDSKMFRKWVLPFIEALAELQHKVVNDALNLVLAHTFLLCFRFYLKTDLRMTMAVAAF